MVASKPLSEKPLGYAIASLCGILGGPVGIPISPLVLLGVSQAIKADSKPAGLRWMVWAAIGMPAAPVLMIVSSFIFAAFLPSFLSDERKSDRAAAESIVKSAATACSSAITEGYNLDMTEYYMPVELSSHATGSCASDGGTFTSVASKFPALRKQAVATVSPSGVVTLTQKPD